MEREILFKAKSIEPSTLGMWFEGSLMVCSVCRYILPENPLTPIGLLKHRVDPGTVCQFAGFTDINGKKVFEGDYDKDGNCVVFCDECHGWQFGEIDIPTKDICIPCHNCDGNFMIGDWIEKFEVVGNIHD